MDFLLDLVGEIFEEMILESLVRISLAIARVVFGPLFIGRRRLHRLKRLRDLRTQQIPSNFATFRRIAESK